MFAQRFGSWVKGAIVVAAVVCGIGAMSGSAQAQQSFNQFHLKSNGFHQHGHNHNHGGFNNGFNGGFNGGFKPGFNGGVNGGFNGGFNGGNFHGGSRPPFHLDPKFHATNLIFVPGRGWVVRGHVDFVPHRRW